MNFVVRLGRFMMAKPMFGMTICGLAMIMLHLLYLIATRQPVDWNAYLWPSSIAVYVMYEAATFRPDD